LLDFGEVIKLHLRVIAHTGHRFGCKVCSPAKGQLSRWFLFRGGREDRQKFNQVSEKEGEACLVRVWRGWDSNAKGVERTGPQALRVSAR
jgi:hypothetical protein